MPATRSVGSWWPGGLLVVAAIVVGLAIVAEGATARVLNGVGALLWLVAAVGLVRSLWAERHRLTLLAVVAALVVVLAVAVRPRDLAAAAIGFVLAGSVVAAMTRPPDLRWVLLVPALWLPVHLLRGVGRALLTEGGQVRSEPPPTAAVVPLVMVTAALVGGLAVGWWQRRRTSIEAANIAGAPLPRA